MKKIVLDAKYPLRSGLIRGFTLIELLIVVAIIAILAAIAVPNYLEAQVRAKNAQTLANMRSIMSASEAYRVDNNGCLPGRLQNFYWIDRNGYWYSVTTPVPYMSSCPEDLYFKLASNTAFWGEQWRLIFHNYGVWDFNIARAILNKSSAPGMWSPIPASSATKSWINTYVIPAMKNCGKSQSANWCMHGFGPNYMGEGQQGGFTYTVPYDPTNGTMSGGEIFLFN